MGFRIEVDRPKSNIEPAESTTRTVMLRILIGYTAVLVSRQILKVLLTAIVRCFGADPSPMGREKKLKVDDDNVQDEWGQHVEVDVKVPRILKGWDLWGAAFVKFMSYLLLAMLITTGCPWLFEQLGIHCSLELVHPAL